MLMDKKIMVEINNIGMTYHTLKVKLKPLKI